MTVRTATVAGVTCRRPRCARGVCDDGAAHRQVRADDARGRAARRHRPPADHVRGVRAPTARRPPLRRRRRHRPVPGSVAAVQVRRRRPGDCSRTSSTPTTLAYLADYRFSGDVDGYPEGELYFPGSPVLSVHGTFAECVRPGDAGAVDLQPRLAIASAAARMVSAAEGRPLIEMGSRRTHEEAGRRRGARRLPRRLHRLRRTSRRSAATASPRSGTSAHAFTLLHTTADGPDERAAFRAQVDALGVGHHAARRHLRHHRRRGQRGRRRRAPNWARCASTPATSACWPARSAPSSTASARPNTRSWCPSDLDEFAIAALRAEPVDSTASAPRWSPGRARRRRAWSTSSSRSTASPSRSAAATRSPTAAASRPCGWPSPPAPSSRRSCTRPTRRRGDADGLVGHRAGPSAGARRARSSPTSTCSRARDRVAAGLLSLPWDGLKLSRGEPAIPTRMVDATRQA